MGLEFQHSLLAEDEFFVYLDGKEIGRVWKGRTYWYASQDQKWANNSLNGALTREQAVAFLVKHAEEL
jgi:hypothetical protein